MGEGDTQRDLFGATGLPEGFVYRPEFITRDEEAALIEHVRGLPLAEATYKEYTARRRTVCVATTLPSTWAEKIQGYTGTGFGAAGGSPVADQIRRMGSATSTRP